MLNFTFTFYLHLIKYWLMSTDEANDPLNWIKRGRSDFFPCLLCSFYSSRDKHHGHLNCLKKREKKWQTYQEQNCKAGSFSVHVEQLYTLRVQIHTHTSSSSSSSRVCARLCTAQLLKRKRQTFSSCPSSYWTIWQCLYKRSHMWNTRDRSWNLNSEGVK